MSLAHPKDHKKISYKLPLGGLAFLVLLIVGFVSLPRPEFVYTLSNSDTQRLDFSEDNFISPEKAKEMLDFSPVSYRLIDIRNPHDYIKGHFEGALNVPSHSLLDPSYKNWLNEKQVVNILYGTHPDEVIPYWLLLHQIGYNNHLVLLGAYDAGTGSSDLLNSVVYLEQVDFDFDAFSSKTTNSNNLEESEASSKSIPVLPVKNEKKAAQGGC